MYGGKNGKCHCKGRTRSQRKGGNYLKRYGYPIFRSDQYVLPFQPSKNVQAPKALSEMTREEFDARMAEGLRQADNGEVSSVEDVRKRIIGELHGLL